jgi:hypothetical protein
MMVNEDTSDKDTIDLPIPPVCLPELLATVLGAYR